jgi:glycosyltransferase involved in cell wall biosynthesis
VRLPKGWATGSAGVTAVAAVCALVLAGLRVTPLQPTGRAWLLILGFALLALAMLPLRTRLLTPVGIAVLFLPLGGFSALIASGDVARCTALGPTSPEAFPYAALVTGAAGLAAVAGATGVSRYGGAGSVRRSRPKRDVIPWAKALVALGALGILIALARFALSQPRLDDLWTSMKSLWQGSSYFLLLASFAVPGFGLWLHAELRSLVRRRQLLGIAAALAAYLAALVPTGQRGLAVEIALVVVAVLLATSRLSATQLGALLVVGVVFLGVTQAIRNELSETRAVPPRAAASPQPRPQQVSSCAVATNAPPSTARGFSVGSVLQRLKPDNWYSLYGTQLASFQWTWDVAAHRERLDIPNTFLYAAVKPVPRQLLPNKVQGFGDEFTAQLYPGAHGAGVSFATPLVAEADYVFGLIGVVAIFFLFGSLLASAELYIVRGGPPVLVPVLTAAIVWTGFVFMRGDFANALVVSFGWIIPLAAVSLIAGFRPLARGNKLVVDALQVPFQFSGVGRQVLAIGRGLKGGSQTAFELRCAADVCSMLKSAFPAGTQVRMPLRRSRPAVLRILYQQALAPLLDRRSTFLVCPGDQAPLWGRAPVLLVVHDVRRLTRGGSTTLLERLFYRMIVPRGIRRAVAVVTVSSFSRDEIKRVVGDCVEILVVADHPAPRVAYPSPTDRDHALLSVGALRPYKGADTLIEALAITPANLRPKVVWVGTGEGNERKLVLYAEQLGVSDRISFMGWLDEDALARLYRDCFATVSPSTYEGYGLPVAESLSYGRPTVAADIPAFRELADDAALYFRPGDAQSLANALRRLHEDEALPETLARKALARSRVLAEQRPLWGDVILDLASRQPQARASWLRSAAVRRTK